MNLGRQWRILRRLIAIDIINASIYRGEMLVFMLSVIVTPILGLFVWRTALAGGADLPRDEGFFTTYYLMLAVVNWLTSAWLALFFANNIRTGYIVKYLVQPSSPHFRWIANNISEKLVKGCFLLPLLAIAAFGFRDSLELPSDAGRWLLFGISVVASAAMKFASDVVIGCLAFWIEDVGAIERGRTMLATVLGGQLVPLALMPEWLNGVLVAQPFRYMFSFPLEIITGDLAGQDLVLGFVLQAAWLVAITWGAYALWRKGLRGYAAFGS